MNSIAGDRPLRIRMHPPLDVPSAPPRSSTDSRAIPRSTIAALSDAVLVPGSPVASPGSASGSPSVCSTSYLGIPQTGHGSAASVAERSTCMTRIRGGRGDAFRTEWPRQFKNVGPLWQARSLRISCGVTREIARTTLPTGAYNPQQCRRDFHQGSLRVRTSP